MVKEKSICNGRNYDCIRYKFRNQVLHPNVAQEQKYHNRCEIVFDNTIIYLSCAVNEKTIWFACYITADFDTSYSCAFFFFFDISITFFTIKT